MTWFTSDIQILSCKSLIYHSVTKSLVYSFHLFWEVVAILNFTNIVQYDSLFYLIPYQNIFYQLTLNAYIFNTSRFLIIVFHRSDRMHSCKSLLNLHFIYHILHGGHSINTYSCILGILCSLSLTGHLLTVASSMCLFYLVRGAGFVQYSDFLP